MTHVHPRVPLREPGQAFARPALSLLARALRGFWRVLQGYQMRRVRREVARLQAFDDRLLKDIGLQRADVDWALMQPRWADPSAALAARAKRRQRAARWSRRMSWPSLRR